MKRPCATGKRKRGARLGALWCALSLGGCVGTRDVALDIPFVATLDGTAFSCHAAAGGFAPSDLRFYVHDVALVDAGGHAVPLQLADDGVWQHRGVALLDLETGSDHCAGGTSGTHTTLSGRAPAGDYRALRFVLGVPFARNHADAALAEPPLNLGRMHWGWQGGYKFLRFEGASPESAFRLHLGSTGCEGTIDHITRCARPNRAVAHLDGFAAGHSAVALDLSALLRAGRDHAEQPIVSCMSEPDEAACRGAFATLGIDVRSGTPGGVQTFFKLIPRTGAAG